MVEVRVKPRRMSFHTSLVWDSGMRMRALHEGKPALEVAGPPEVGGPDRVITPDDLLTSALDQ